jgi:hypothetical protein
MSGSKKPLILTGRMVETKADSREVKASEKTEIVNFRVTPAFRRRMRQLALDHDLNLSELLAAAVAAFEEKHQKGETK